MRQVLAWARDHDHGVAVRLAVALAPWWLLRGRLAAEHSGLSEAAGHAEPGSEVWCAAQFWLGRTALNFASLAEALGHFTAVRDAIGNRPPSRVLVDCLASRSTALANLGRAAEAADDGSHALALARGLGYPAGEALALVNLSIAAEFADDFDGYLRFAHQAERTPADSIPGWIARLSCEILTAALIADGDLAAAGRTCAAGLDRAQEAGDLRSLTRLLTQMVKLDMHAGRFEAAAEHLREGLQIAVRTGRFAEVHNALDWCGSLCAATGRAADAITVWAAEATLARKDGLTSSPADARRRDEALSRARQPLGGARARVAEERGAAMSMATAAEYALLLTAPSSQPAAPPKLAGLSARERELVTLVAQGHTNAQIAGQLYISVRTVSSHLDRIRDKTGARRRADLTRLALTAGLV